jgi:hypothetical protein
MLDIDTREELIDGSLEEESTSLLGSLLLKTVEEKVLVGDVEEAEVEESKAAD